MRVNNITFTGVTPIIAKNKKTLNALDKHIKENAPNTSYTLVDLTHIYKRYPSKGIFTDAANKYKKRVAFLVTGEEDSKYSMMDTGWSSETAPARHISEDLVELDKYNTKERQQQFSTLAKRAAEDWDEWVAKRGY